MSLKRVGILLHKEFAQGYKSVIFIMAVVVPIVISLVLTLIFGTIFAPKPKLGITDDGSSQMAVIAAGLDSITFKTYDSDSGLQAATESGAVDVGIVVPAGFDDSTTGEIRWQPPHNVKQRRVVERRRATKTPTIPPCWRRRR